MLIGHHRLCSHMTIIYTINTVHEIAHSTMEKKQKVQDRTNVVFFFYSLIGEHVQFSVCSIEDVPTYVIQYHIRQSMCTIPKPIPL